jgi:hypothetical protein
MWLLMMSIVHIFVDHRMGNMLNTNKMHHVPGAPARQPPQQKEAPVPVKSPQPVWKMGEVKVRGAPAPFAL